MNMKLFLTISLILNVFLAVLVFMIVSDKKSVESIFDAKN